ncbi:MAG: hypothetical protein BJ554DRAFT_1701, partial [Olpidium bornovanus]
RGPGRRTGQEEAKREKRGGNAWRWRADGGANFAATPPPPTTPPTLVNKCGDKKEKINAAIPASLARASRRRGRGVARRFGHGRRCVFRLAGLPAVASRQKRDEMPFTMGGKGRVCQGLDNRGTGSKPSC